ncbi:hypothetical protein HY493_05100 [Candidatus Woesearchaeota archaeon]|nr:hypothetical protein [Candidatus Woesearchaeota archaeon]
MDLSQLETALRQAWARETSADPDSWTIENPAWGQCAVTALVVNDHLGGKLIWAPAKLPDGREVSHYFNELPNGVVDLTKVQFPPGTLLPPGIEKKKDKMSTREYVLSFPATQTRYLLLKQRVFAVMPKTD